LVGEYVIFSGTASDAEIASTQLLIEWESSLDGVFNSAAASIRDLTKKQRLTNPMDITISNKGMEITKVRQAR